MSFFLVMRETNVSVLHYSTTTRETVDALIRGEAPPMMHDAEKTKVNTLMQTFNGTMPGPTLYLNVGDILVWDEPCFASLLNRRQHFDTLPSQRRCSLSLLGCRS